ncbi:hypothetical protein [Lihuaxuella thermophila]|uniref:Uncharacterized protein n=1 Tax=Lihuaxuella thermophila TaxID=1173111 RepID=A0A1H8G9N9_9BACL|nr:hypothetical protein [Lihuaxuella thermophila]SEN39998.1 hypothetical protein SAMN05444955_110129 [Lihuaxuella thermophila]
MSNRKELLMKLADKIERELRQTIMTHPQPCLTENYAFCEVCLNWTWRKDVRLVVEGPGDTISKRVCKDCIQKHQIQVPDCESSLEFEARTIAIERIRGRRADWLDED